MPVQRAHAVQWDAGDRARARLKRSISTTAAKGWPTTTRRPETRAAQYRTTDVDIESTTDVSGGYDVGWIYPGEWLNYTINVTDRRQLHVGRPRRVVRARGGTFHVEIQRRGCDWARSRFPTLADGRRGRTSRHADSARRRERRCSGSSFDTVGPSGAIGNVNYLRVRAPTSGSTPFNGTPCGRAGHDRSGAVRQRRRRGRLPRRDAGQCGWHNIGPATSTSKPRPT